MESAPRAEVLTAEAQPENGAYQRYAFTESGVSPMALPGTPGAHYTAEGLEHLPGGAPSYEPDNRRAMMEKRWRKLDSIYEELRARKWNLRRFGVSAKADLGIICWGSVTGAVREATARALRAGKRVAALVPQVLMPLPRDEITAFGQECQALLIPELNMRGQFAAYLRGRTGVSVYQLNKYEGLPFTPGEITAKIDAIWDELDLPTAASELEGYC